MFADHDYEKSGQYRAGKWEDDRRKSLRRDSSMRDFSLAHIAVKSPFA